MNDGLKILHQLIDKQERGARSVPSVVPAFYGGSHEAVEKAVATLRTAAKAGLVALVSGRRHEEHLIKRVRLVNISGLYAFLGRTPKDSKLSSAEAKIRGAGLPIGLETIIHAVLEKWDAGKTVFGMQLSEVDAVIQALKVCSFIQSYETSLPHMRRLSVLATGDSKFVERNHGLVAGVLGLALGLEDMTSKEIYEAVGIFKNPHPIYVRGPLRSRAGSDTELTGTIRPFVGMLPETMSAIELAQPVDYVMTVENFASFYDYCSQIEGNYVAIFTSGVASRARQEIIRSLANQAAALSSHTRFYHWGDIDGGGLMIFKQISELVPRALEPHQMSVDLALQHGVPARPRPAIASLSALGSISGLAEMLSMENAHTLEQEALDPVAPDLSLPRPLE